MRNLLLAATLLATACDGGPGALPDPPILKVTSPSRSLIQSSTAKVTATGTVTPNAKMVPVSKVMVNNVVVNVGADGSFTTQIDTTPGAMLIHTEALDANGGKATDTRSVESGQLRAPGANIESAIT